MIRLAENWAQEMSSDIENAHASIVMSSLSFLPPRGTNCTSFGALWLALCAAALRGVKVDLFLPVPSNTHPATLQNITSANRAKCAGIDTNFVKLPRLLHAKSTVIDSLVCWIGSGNLTAAAANHNHEIYCRFENADIAERIVARWRALV